MKSINVFRLPSSTLTIHLLKGLFLILEIAEEDSSISDEYDKSLTQRHAEEKKNRNVVSHISLDQSNTLHSHTGRQKLSQYNFSSGLEKFQFFFSQGLCHLCFHKESDLVCSMTFLVGKTTAHNILMMTKKVKDQPNTLHSHTRRKKTISQYNLLVNLKSFNFFFMSLCYFYFHSLVAFSSLYTHKTYIVNMNWHGICINCK